MNKNSRRLGVFILIISCITLTAIILRTVALLGDYNAATGYFDSGIMISIASAVAAVACILSPVFGLSLKKVELSASHDSPSTYVPAGALAISIISLTIYLVRAADIPGIITNGEASIPSLLAIATAVFAILAIVHLYMTTLYTTAQVKVRAYLALGAILFYTLFATFMYFDSTSAMNAHVKITDQMAVLFAAVFMLFEARISLGRAKWRGYVGAGLLALAVTSYAAIPNLIVYFVRSTTLSLSLELSIFLLAFSFYAISRLLLTCKLGEAGEGKSVTVMREYAEAREKELIDGSSVKSDDDMQITIDDLFGEELSTASEEGDEASLEEAATDDVSEVE